MRWWSKLKLRWERDAIYRELAALKICRECSAEISILSDRPLCDSCYLKRKRSKRDQLFDRLKKLDGVDW